MFLLSLQVLNWNTVYVFAMFMHANIVIMNIHMQEKTTFLKKYPDCIGKLQPMQSEQSERDEGKGDQPERQTPSGCRVQGL